LADTLVRAHGLPFRTAHAIAAAVVQDAAGRGLDAADFTPSMVADAARGIAARPLALDAAALAAALDPRAFVRARTIPGGPAPTAMRRALDEAARILAADRDWLARMRSLSASAGIERAQRAARLVARSTTTAPGVGAL
jgi:argininosuccinate lyase